MIMYSLPPPANVEAAAQVMRDFIKGQHAAAHVDEAMAIMRNWLSNEDRRRRLRILPYEH
jgi:hypothetical protein